MRIDRCLELLVPACCVAGAACLAVDSHALVQTLEQIARSLWPGVPVAPVMETGATDGKYFRLVGIPTYGVSGLFGDVNDVRAHGRDERIGVEAFYQAVDFYYRLIRALAE